MAEIKTPRLASSVIVLRDGERGPETLLLRRNEALMFAGGFWVFPGGSVDAEDIAAGGDDLQQATRIAAAREAQEEAGLAVAADEMVLLSRWTTPEVEPRRFATWFYLAPVEASQDVVIDGGEIHDAHWTAVRDALARHQADDLNLLPPTYISLLTIAAYDSVAQVLDQQRAAPSPDVLPVLVTGGEHVMTLYAGDAGYATGDAAAAGARHRAVLEEHHWVYQYRDVPAGYPALVPGVH